MDATASVEVDGCTTRAEVINELRLGDEADWHVIARELNSATEDSLEALLYKGHDPNLRLLVAWGQRHVTIEYRCTCLAHHYVVLVLLERELLHFVTCDIVSAPKAAVKVLEVVRLNVVGVPLRHLMILEVEPEHTLFLRRLEVVALVWEVGMIELALVSDCIVVVSLATEQAIVGEVVVVDLRYATIDVDQGAV